MRLSVQITGEDVLERDLLEWAQRAQDMRPALAIIADNFRVLERKQFESEGRYASGGWAPLRPATVRARHGSAHPILRAPGADGGRLRRSLTTRGAAGNIRQVSEDEVIVGTRDPRAKFHQRGTRNMVARPPVALTEADRREWVRIIQQHLLGALGRGA